MSATYYFEIDTGVGYTHLAITHDHEAYKTLGGAIDAKSEAWRIINAGIERVKAGPLPRKPAGIEWEQDKHNDWIKRGFPKKKGSK